MSRNIPKIFSEKIYMGIDESNHGRFPEIFVATRSDNKDDVKESFYQKIRNPSLDFFENFSPREYSFLLAEENDYRRIPKEEFKGVVIASLVQGYKFFPESNLEILVDGDLTSFEKYFIKDMVSKNTPVYKEKISVFAGPKFDEFYKIVNLADAIANYLFRKSSPEKLSKNKYKRFLLM